MKCIKCQTDNKLKDRTTNQGRCKNCWHPFAFEPTSMEAKRKFTDRFFAKAIADFSANSTLFFTEKQFLYVFNKKKETKAISGWTFWFIYIILWIWLAGILWVVWIPFKVTGFVCLSLVYNFMWLVSFYSMTNEAEMKQTARKECAVNLIVFGITVFGLGVLVNITFINSFFWFLVTTGLGLLSIYLGQKQKAKIAAMPAQAFIFNQSELQEWISRWETVNGSITNLLPSPREEISQAQINPDLGNYSFDRVVVCDNSSIAQMLIANHFHFEHNCAILSVTGYPQSVFKPVMEMLRRNPELKVYAFHNASPKGVGLVHHLQTSQNWFAEHNATIYDLGLLPRQILKNPKMFIRYSQESANEAKNIAEAVRQSLSVDEIAWLEKGLFVELESFGPKKLMQVLSQGIAMSREADIDEESALVSIDVYDSDSDVYLISSETFG